MANTTIGHLLEHARSYERRLEGRYAAIRDASKDDGVRLLTYYLSRHRRHLDDALSGYGRPELERVLAVRLKHDIAFEPAQPDPLEGSPEALDGRRLLEAAVTHDEKLVDLYRRMLEQPLGEEATALVRSLIRLEEKDIVMLKKMIAMNYF